MEAWHEYSTVELKVPGATRITVTDGALAAEPQ